MAYGDIRLGDYWGEKYDTNTKGVSAVVVKTPKGMEIFEAVKNRLNVEEVTLNHILAAQSYGKTHFIIDKGDVSYCRICQEILI